MTEFKPIKEGKVREIYDNGDSLIMVATDRISAFDVILKNKVTKKGTVLTQMSKFWFDYTRDLLPNHMLSVDVKDMPEFFQQPQFDGNSMMCRKLTMLPIECIVRGYITGSGWASYQKTGKVCGIQLPEGLKESDKLPEPIYTPSTKAELGAPEKPNLIDEFKFSSVDYNYYYLSGGYAYNWVFAYNWLLGASVMPSVGIRKAKGDKLQGNEIFLDLKNFSFDCTSRFGIVWNNTHWFAGASWISHLYMYRKKRLSVTNSVNYVNIYAGFFFNRKKQYHK